MTSIDTADLQALWIDMDIQRRAMRVLAAEHEANAAHYQDNDALADRDYNIGHFTGRASAYNLAANHLDRLADKLRRTLDGD